MKDNRHIQTENNTTNVEVETVEKGSMNLTNRNINLISEKTSQKEIIM